MLHPAKCLLDLTLLDKGGTTCVKRGPMEKTEIETRLCLLVGAFNPFTFKVIIDKYDPIAIYFFFYFILLYNTVLVLPYIDMNPPRVFMSSQS